MTGDDMSIITHCRNSKKIKVHSIGGVSELLLGVMNMFQEPTTLSGISTKRTWVDMLTTFEGVLTHPDALEKYLDGLHLDVLNRMITAVKHDFRRGNKVSTCAY